VDDRADGLQRKALAVGAVIATAMIVAILASVGSKKDADWWAALGQWVGGIGSIIAAIAAVWIAQRGWDLAAKESREREASLVTAWISSGDDGTPVLSYINAGALPAYVVAVKAWLAGHVYEFDIGNIAPTGKPGTALQDWTEVLRREVLAQAVVKVGAKNQYRTDELSDPTPSFAVKRASRELTRSIRLETTFRRGKHRWRLDHDGNLTQL
jgi:uncharacterized membrane protein (DUF441 family)